MFQTQTDVGLEKLVNWNFGSRGDVVSVNERTKRAKMVAGPSAEGGVGGKKARKQQRKKQRRAPMAELLAYYLHMILGGKVCNTAGKVVSHLSVAEINEQSNCVLEIFPMLNNKDMFGDCYQALLMKRLLRRTFNEDNEKHVRRAWAVG